MIKAFHEVEFPRGISYGSTFGPSFSTDIVTMPNGSEQRNVNWEYPRCSGNLTTGIKRESQFSELLKFFYNRKGKAYGFRFYDWLDHKAEYILLGIGDGTVSTYQLIKNYPDTELDQMSVRKIVKPIAGTLHLYKFDCTPPEGETVTDTTWQKYITRTFTNAIPDGSEVTSGWTLNTVNGKVTFSAPIAVNVGVIATYEFDVPVRFDTDTMAANYSYFKAYGWSDIPIIELKF